MKTKHSTSNEGVSTPPVLAEQKTTRTEALTLKNKITYMKVADSMKEAIKTVINTTNRGLLSSYNTDRRVLYYMAEIVKALQSRAVKCSELHSTRIDHLKN